MVIRHVRHKFSDRVWEMHDDGKCRYIAGSEVFQKLGQFWNHAWSESEFQEWLEFANTSWDVIEMPLDPDLEVDEVF